MLQNLRKPLRREPSVGVDLTGWAGLIALAVAVGISYFLAARLSLALLTKPEGVAVFWPAAGVAAGVLIALGPRARWPVIVGTMAATILANLFGDRNLWSAVLFAVCNAGEAVLAAWFIERFYGPGFRLGRLRNVLGLFAAAIVGTAVSAIGGTIGIKAVPQRGRPAVYDLAALVRIGRAGDRHGCTAADRARFVVARPAVAQRDYRRCAVGRGAGADVWACDFPTVGPVGDHRTGCVVVRTAVVARGSMPADLCRGRRFHRELFDRVDDDVRHRLFRQPGAFNNRPRFWRPSQHSACDAQRVGARGAVCRKPRQAKTGRNSAAGQRNATLPD